MADDGGEGGAADLVAAVAAGDASRVGALLRGGADARCVRIEALGGAVGAAFAADAAARATRDGGARWRKLRARASAEVLPHPLWQF